MEDREDRLWFLFQFLHDVEEKMSKEEQKQVMIEKAINLKLMCDYVVSCSYLDIVLIGAWCCECKISELGTD